MKVKVVYLYENMSDSEGKLLFESYHPYYLKFDSIENEGNVKIKLHEIWVDFEVRNIEK